MASMFRAAAVHYRLTDWLDAWAAAAPVPGMPPKKKPWWRFW
jgi:hypothetical protein